MRIALVVPVFSPYVSSSELWLAEGLSRRGHDVRIITSHQAGTRAREIEQLGEDPSPSRRRFEIVKLDGIPFVHGEATVPFGVPSAVGSNTDVLLIQEDYPPFSQFAVASATVSEVPYIVTLERYMYTSPLWFRFTLNCLDVTVLPRIWVRSEALTFHSRASLSFLRSRGAPPEKLQYTPSCTDTRLFTRKQSPEPADEREGASHSTSVRILAVGRLHQAKGFDTLLFAIRDLVNKGYNPEVTIHGRGRQLSRLSMLATHLGLQERVRIDTAITPLIELPNLYSKSDIYVQPSFHEPFGMATLEAMSCGLPIVASATGGLLDLVETGENGFRFRPGDWRELSAALEPLLKSEEQRVSMGLASRQRAVSRFDCEVVARLYENLLDSFHI